MESALTPREIQARIRAGESVAEVAMAAGVPEENIETYAGPVLAEREHAVTMARVAPVRRRGEGGGHRLLGDTVNDALTAAGIAPEDVTWDAWRNEDRRWSVRVGWPDGHAVFEFDQRGRFSTAADDSARALIAEHPPAAPAAPGDPDSEPTVDLNDELAIVRVVQDHTEPPSALPDTPAARIIKLPNRADTADQDSDDDEPDDYSPAELEQVDGVYDIIPNPRSDMDVLYDMLAGFNEDSVRIYTGLTQPVNTAPIGEPVAPPPSLEPAQRSMTDDATSEVMPTPVTSEQPKPRRRSGAKSGPAQTRRKTEPSHTRKDTANRLDAKSRRADQPDAPDASRSQQAKPEQPPGGPQPESPPTPKPRGRRRRAAVPSWDEIMFGGPPTTSD